MFFSENQCEARKVKVSTPVPCTYQRLAYLAGLVACFLLSSGAADEAEADFAEDAAEAEAEADFAEDAADAEEEADFVEDAAEAEAEADCFADDAEAEAEEETEATYEAAAVDAEATDTGTVLAFSSIVLAASMT